MLKAKFNLPKRNLCASFNMPDCSMSASFEMPNGTKNYEKLENKPSINGVELIGNKTSANLGLATSEQGVLAETALQEIPSYYITETELAGALNTKQNIINDLSEIRQGASLGSTSVQPSDILGMVTSVNGVTAVNGNVTLSIPSEVTETTVSNWGFTKNIGTVTSVNNVQPVNGNVTLSIPQQVNADWNATSGVAEILNKPTIPTDTNDLTNGAGYITNSALSGYATENWVGQQGYITSASVSSLTDVELTNLSDGETLTYDSANSKWINSMISVGNGLLPYGISTTAAETVQKVVSIPEITELNVGQVIVVQPTVTSTVADSTLKLNDFPAYTMRYNNANITTSTDSIVWNLNYPTAFIFDGTYWVFLCHGFDVNTTYTMNNLLEAGKTKVGIGKYAVTRYSIVAQKMDGTWEKIVNTSEKFTAQPTKTVNTRGFRLGALRHYNSTSTLANGALIPTNVLYLQISTMDIRYSTNCGNPTTWLAGDYIYLVGTMHSDGLFYFDTTQWWSNTLPSTNDGKLYVRIGIALADAGYSISFLLDHPVFYHDGTGIKQYIQGGGGGGGAVNDVTVNGTSVLENGVAKVVLPLVLQQTGQSTTDVMSQKAVTDGLVNSTSLLLPSANSIQLGQDLTLYSGGKLYNKSIFLTAGDIPGSTNFLGNISMWADNTGREFMNVNGNTLLARTANDHYTVMALFFDENGYAHAYTRGEKVYTGAADQQTDTMNFGIATGTNLFSSYVINTNLENAYINHIFKDGKGDWFPIPHMIDQDNRTLTWENVTGRTAIQIDVPKCWWEVDYTFTNDTSSAITGCQLPCQGTLLWDSNGRTSVAFSVPANSTYSGKCFVETYVNYLVLADSAGKLKQTVTAKRIIVENGIDARLCINGGYFNPHLMTYTANNGLAISATKLIPDVITAYPNEAKGYTGQTKISSGNILMWNGTVWKQINN